MSEKKTYLPKKVQSVIHVIAAVLLNLGIVFSGVYILFHILDKYNPHKFIFTNLPWLPIVIPVLFVLSVLLYDLLLFDGAFKKRRFKKARMWLIILCDLILFAALSITIYLRTCTNLDKEHTVDDAPTMLATPPNSNAAVTVAPVSAAPVTPDESHGPTYAPGTAYPMPTSSGETPAPTPAGATPEATLPGITDEPYDPNETPVPIPGLLGSKYAEKFSDKPKEQTYERSEVSETLDDGTERSLIYTYSGRQAAVDIYHYKKGKLEYQIADIYVRDIACLNSTYCTNLDQKLKTQGYAEEIGAIVATNGDYFNSGKIDDGIVIRNGGQLFPKNGAKQTSFSRDICVIRYDGTMKVYDCVLDRIDYDEILSTYPYHAFNFGPKLLNDDGTAKDKFNSLLGPSNPRTVLGYYEPGHYALIVVLGVRDVIDYNGKNQGQSKSPGFTLAELSQLCTRSDLLPGHEKMQMAYNLDGGGSSSMYWNHSVFGHNDRAHGDVVAVIDP